MTNDNSRYQYPRWLDDEESDDIYGDTTYRRPPRWWTLPWPFLLTFPVAAWYLLVAAISSLYSCFDSCTPGIPLLGPIAFGEFFLLADSFITLVVALVRPDRRWDLRRRLWVVCALALLGGGYVYAGASSTP